MDDCLRRVERLLEELARDEKLRLVRGRADPEGTATSCLPGVDRLGIPEYRLVDRPLGVCAEGKRATAFPASIGSRAKRKKRWFVIDTVWKRRSSGSGRYGHRESRSSYPP